MNNNSKEKLPEPDLITNTRKILSIIQVILIGSMAIPILFYILMVVIGGILGVEVGNQSIEGYLIEIGIVYVIMNIIKNGQKRVSILPMFGGIANFVIGARGVEASNGDIINVICYSYTALLGIFLFISMAYILSSLKFEFYCQYVLYNNSIENKK